MSEVGVLVLNWNGRRWLEPCFSALLAQQGPSFEAWLVDNGSSDGSLALLRNRFPQVRLLSLGSNLGFGAAYNRAIAAVETPLVALLNNDTVVQPGWLSALVDDLEANPEAAAIGSKLLYLEQPNVVNHAGGRLTVLGAAFDLGLGAADGAEFDQPGTTGCASGAAMLLRRQAFLDVGSFDERYFAYFEDADLCWRLWLRGLSVRYQPRARVLHAYGGSTGQGRLSPFRVRHCQTNRLLNMAKNLEARNLFAMLPASLGYDAMRVLGYLRSGRPALALAILRGSARFLHLLPGLLPERRRVQARRVRSDADLRRLGVLAGLRQAAWEWRRLESQAPAHGP